jgi:HlyD family secretion protein
MNRMLLAAPLLVSLLTACSNEGDQREMHGTLERDRLELVAESHERIADVLVREGDRVPAGAVLLRQEAGTMQPRLDQARAALAEAERRLADAIEGPRQREIDEARAALAGAESSLETERREFERVDQLVERRLLSASSRDQARARRDAAVAARDQSRARLRLLQEGTRPEQVREAEAAVQRARAVLAELETSAALYEVRASRAGWIEALPYARIHVPEPLRAGVTAGSRVAVSIDGVEGVLDGTVRFISAEAAFTPYYALTQKDRARLSYLAEIDIDDPRAATLPVGVPVQVTLVAPPPEPR